MAQAIYKSEKFLHIKNNYEFETHLNGLSSLCNFTHILCMAIGMSLVYFILSLSLSEYYNTIYLTITPFPGTFIMY